ncbi:hypothetical protein C0W35_19830 [Photobacterium kishitanii]|uniref:hypothetical protein n=1 Tax=Photobacterium kishitanii TaxID=318456 RepID=UPI000D16E90D|nr:hypothetical protein [Photobacterium kishitanii]PSU88817.1 hypothetical protein C0W35_19830 [Photobacterium kishitanii]
MSYKKGLSIGIINIPIQILSAIYANVLIINEIGKINLEPWFLLISTMPLFSAMEASFPLLMVKKINKANYSWRSVNIFLFKAIAVSSSLQIIAICIIFFLFGKVDISLVLFLLGAYLRTVSNIIISIPYSKNRVVLEKIYRLFFLSSYPILVVILFSLWKKIDLNEIFIIWFFSGLIVFIISIFSFFMTKNEFNNNSDKSESIELDFRENISLLITTIPGLFIFNLSIYYLKLYSTPVDVVLYGLVLQLINVFYVTNNLIPSVFAPTISREFLQGGRVKVKVLRVLDFNIIMTVISLSFIILLGSDVLHIAISKSFTTDEINLVIVTLVIFILIESIQVTLTYLAITSGNYNYQKQSIASAILVTMLSLFFVPKYGYIGLVSSICIAQILTCLPFNTYSAVKYFRIDIKDIVNRFFILLFITSILYLLKLNVSESLMCSLSIFLVIMFSLSFYLLVTLKKIRN